MQVAEDKLICKELVVDGTPSDSWKLWTTKEGLQSFFSRNCNFELKLNGPFEMYFDPTAVEGFRGSEDCHVLSFIPEEMISFSWNAPPKFTNVRKERTFVVVTFRLNEEGGTRVTLRHMGWQDGPEWDKVYAYFTDAWDIVMSRFQMVMNTGQRLW